MVYFIVALTMINALALIAVTLVVAIVYYGLPGMVETAVAQEIRLQDDRIEKRVQRAKGPAEDEEPTPVDNLSPIRAGMPTRRR